MEIAVADDSMREYLLLCERQGVDPDPEILHAEQNTRVYLLTCKKHGLDPDVEVLQMLNEKKVKKTFNKRKRDLVVTEIESINREMENIRERFRELAFTLKEESPSGKKVADFKTFFQVEFGTNYRLMKYSDALGELWDQCYHFQREIQETIDKIDK